jgi:hypothetical protein
MNQTIREAHDTPLELIMKTILQSLATSLLVFPALGISATFQEGEMAGYLFGPVGKVPEEFNGGFSLYAASWPLVCASDHFMRGN